jgi:hypothetical protein
MADRGIFLPSSFVGLLWSSIDNVFLHGVGLRIVRYLEEVSFVVFVRLLLG